MGDYTHLIGHRLPGGSYELPEYLAWLWSDAVLAEPDPELAHPALGYFVAMQGSGVSVQDIFDLMGADADSGVMFGECELEFDGELVPGRAYEVEGEVVDVVRKQGKRAGVFDRMVFRIRVREPGGRTVVTNTNTWIFPRREEP